MTIKKIMIRGFKVCKGFEDKGINLPKRSTEHSAGYDFEAAEDVTIKPQLQHNHWHTGLEMDHHYNIKPTLVPTGIKAYMKQDEVLKLYNRSSNPMKFGLVLANSVGVVDSDYYENPDNDGHIMFAFYNFSGQPVTITKGQKVGQGCFEKFLTVDDEDKPKTKRQGGIGSTGN